MSDDMAIGFIVGFIIAAVAGLISIGSAKRNGMWEGFMAALHTSDPLYIDKVKPTIDRFDGTTWDKAKERNDAPR